VSQSKFVVIPSEWYDNSPLVIYESFSMGKPVIGTRIGGIPELIEHGVNGYLFEMKAVDELVQRIGELWGDHDKIIRFGKNAREKAEREFDHETHYKKIYQMYKELIDG